MDPKITHVPPCKCKHHKNLCDNMAKSTKEIQFDTKCSGCIADAAKDSGLGLGLDRRLKMAEAVDKRISELEQQGKVIVDNLPSEKTDNTSTKSSSASTPLSKQRINTTESDWGLDDVPVFQPPPKSIGEDAKTTKLATRQTPGPTFTNPPALLNPKSNQAPQLSVSKKNDTSDPFFDDDSDSEEETLYQQGKEREEWLSVPEAKNGNGVADKPTGVLETLYNTFTWKYKPKFTLKEAKKDEPPLDIGKVDSDDEPWEDHGEWVHIVENVEDN